MGRMRIKKPKALIVNPTGRPGGNHEKRMFQLIADGRLRIEAGHFESIRIEHDDWCGVLAGAHYCNCHPTINGIDWDS